MNPTITVSKNVLLNILSSPVAYYAAFAKATGDVCCGVLISQLFYWADRGWDKDGWIYKTQVQLEEETGLTRFNQETARKKLRALGILEEKREGLPAKLFYRLNIERLFWFVEDPTRLRDYSNQGCSDPADKSAASQPTGSGEDHNQYTENTTEITTEISPRAADAAPAVAEKTKPEQPSPTPVPVVVPVDQPTLYDALPDGAPEKQEHLRLLGFANKDREDKRNGHRPRHPNPMVNDQGLTQKLRTEMVNILARIHGQTALLEVDEEYVLLYQDMAERLYRLRDMREDTIAKLEAFSDLYDVRKRDRWGPPVKNQFLEFVSEMYEERLTGQPTNGGGKTNARNGKAGTKHESTATGLVDAYIAAHGPITIDTPYPPDYKQWPTSERERFFNFKYPPQLLREVPGGVEGE